MESIANLTISESENSKKEDHEKFSTKLNKKNVRRKSLSQAMQDRSKFSIWSILKQCVDKELYRFTIPVIWNEPLSLLQRFSENVRYAPKLLHQASVTSDAIERMKLVSAFIISSISFHASRISKPFNPLLGETFELADENYRIVCEQVSHHPPISAYYANAMQGAYAADQKPNWKYYGTIHPQLKLNYLSASLEAIQNEVQSIELTNFNEIYTWHDAKICTHNLVIGKLWFEYMGKIEIVNHALNIKAYLDFKPYSWFNGQVNKVEGFITDEKDKKVCLLSGQWDQYFYSCSDVKNEEFLKSALKAQGKKGVEFDRLSKRIEPHHFIVP